ncbi:MAG: AAA family ATPase [Pseudanabaenales cyanobacterium]|nr:AAA family ATPase [Pseudanabaenales cyanobacterium]
MTDPLSPSQQQAFDRFLKHLPLHHVFILSGRAGIGKTTLLQAVLHQLGGTVFQMKDFIDTLRQHHPLAIEEVFEQLVMEAFSSHDTVVVDDMHLLWHLTCQSGSYPRLRLLDIPLLMLCAYAGQANKRLVFGGQPCAFQSLNQRACHISIERFKQADYQFLCQHYLGQEAAIALEYDKIYRFASKLNAHQLKTACLWLKQEGKLETDDFIQYLRAQQLISNIDLGEVQAVDLETLKGVDDVIESLKANIILPLENDVLATELQLKPKRGVLLAGPPGTGKTTIGRALAHRLKSKFFLIDGTFISGTGNFYGSIHQVFEAAKQNAPSIVFIDDGDVIFEGGEEQGFYRYLLTMLDGLESESAGRVCLMMTAMHVSSLPPALVRSGRIELWLELRLPNQEARSAILTEHLSPLPAALADADISQLVSATEGFTGADLKRLVEDGKTLYAYDRAHQRPLRSSTDYFIAAVELVRCNKERYAEAEAHARQQHSTSHNHHSSYAMVQMTPEDA